MQKVLGASVINRCPQKKEFKMIKRFESAYKPGYVLNDHLSSFTVTDKIKRPTTKHDGQPYRFLFGLASDGVYTALSVTRETVGSYPAFSPLPLMRRLFSVALS